MDLQISVFLLFSLFTAGRSLSCFQCVSGSCTQITCSNGFTNCFSVSYTYNTTVIKGRGCAPASGCVNGVINVGSTKISTSCCNTDLCNVQDAPDSNTPNGNKCYYCDGDIIKNCTNELSCSGTEDRCFTARSAANQTLVVKGCASKSICDAVAFNDANIGNLTCCAGNLCNGGPSVSQSFLFLCCSLLSYFLLH